MRPRIAISVIVIGLAALIAFGLLRRSTQSNGPTQPAPVVENQLPPQAGKSAAPTNQAAPAPVGVVATTPEQDRLARKQANLEAIESALLKGESDPEAVGIIANLIENEDSEVRVSAREASMHLGSTNLIPSLQAALQHVEDPREKVGIMDAIAYLQLPSLPEGGETNDLGPVPGAGRVPPAGGRSSRIKQVQPAPTAPK